MKICDLTQFYSPVSGGVKRYVHEKVQYLREHAPDDRHLLIIPGEKDETITHGLSKVCTIKSPLISRTSRYRVLLRLNAVEKIIEREMPDIIESGDPYQVAWKAVATGEALRIPVIGFYHSHFPEAYLRTASKFLGATATAFVMDLSRRYIRNLYSQFSRTLVPSPVLGGLLREWGVENVENIDLGVNTAVFHPGEETALRQELGIPEEKFLLLYTGRLAFEKNTHTLFEAFRKLSAMEPGRYHLMIVGDGLQRKELEALRSSLPATESNAIHWLPYCADSSQLARIYRMADLFVHPGVQETFGLVTLEAQACGTPVTGIRGSYMDRIIFGGQSHWAAKNSPVALAEAIQRTSRLNLAAMGEAASRQVLAGYSWQKVFDRLFAIYRNVISTYRK